VYAYLYLDNANTHNLITQCKLVCVTHPDTYTTVCVSCNTTVTIALGKSQSHFRATKPQLPRSKYWQKLVTLHLSLSKF